MNAENARSACGSVYLTGLSPVPGMSIANAGKARFVHERVGLGAVFLPAVDAAPVHDDGRLLDAVRHLQIADQLPAFERNLDDLERRIEILRGLLEGAQRILDTPSACAARSGTDSARCGNS